MTSYVSDTRPCVTSCTLQIFVRIMYTCINNGLHSSQSIQIIKPVCVKIFKDIAWHRTR